jgi:hypothetical protein
MTGVQPVLRRVILHLGGNPARIETTIAYAIAYPSAPIIISSEREPGRVLDALEAAMIPPRRVTFDFAAWDTVTNFTETLGLVLVHQPDDLVVVTGRRHMPRALDVGCAAYAGRGIRIVEAPHLGDEGDYPETELRRRWDVARTTVWRRIGVLVHNPWIRARRMKKSIRPAAAELAVLRGDALALAAIIGGRS